VFSTLFIISLTDLTQAVKIIEGQLKLTKRNR
jgi:hypothetical protein